ncbi:MAG: glycoside hydrolase family 38 C-terminal domain-containing protein [Candidatus Borkfalkiaceae bacterium]|nr:glycoside hydrolase family 38 C-terminal domain-containing protein [Clostridia bacterium]MDY6223460.1 glycoside hydrolase family 38 C-terminal domain-containing protein [Christensenellaceae bacterium]
MGAEKKKYYLVCNSHLDPVWMWDWDEGASAALSTFYQAEKLLSESDFVFCHNEALLYEYIEEYSPAIFSAIQEQVKAGKWKIMGGWYLQPDCNLPSGESFVRQIRRGRKYFSEKFNARPTVAVNFDSFGHSVGLVQILKKTGYEGYLCCRPMSWDKDMSPLPDTEFIWRGKDGSEIKVSRVDDLTLYCSGFGTAKSDLERKAQLYKEKSVGLLLWGVGNHGGNPSRKDISDVNEMISTGKLGGEECEIKHSTPEEYFSAAKYEKVFDKSMQPCLIGCYASMSAVKQTHVKLENALFETEKICSLAYMNGLINDYPEKTFTDAERALCKFEFHDLLAGTVCRAAEESSLLLAGEALTRLKKEYDKAFFAYCEQHEKADEGEFPIFVFNGSPYKRKAVIEGEFLIPDSLVSDTRQYSLTVKQNGKIVRSQVIKEGVNINYDRRKRVIFVGELPAGDVARFDVTVKITPKKQFVKPAEIVEEDCFKTASIGRETGLLRLSFGKKTLAENAFCPVMFDDYPDPWGWGMRKIGTNPVDFGLSSCDKGIFAGLKNVNVVEDGDVVTEVEALYEQNCSFVRMDYKIYKDFPYIDVTADVLWNEKDKGLKLRIPTPLKGAFIGQIPYACDEFEKNGEEITAHRFIGVEDGENVLYVANDCAYSFSADENGLYVTLLRGVAYCAHPIGDRPLLEKDRYVPFVEDGRHTFRFRIGYCKRSEVENAVQEFVTKKDGLNYFPHGDTKERKKFEISNRAISLSACYYEDGEYVLRLFNNNSVAETARIGCGGVTAEWSFGKYEVKTVLFNGKRFEEKKVWL